MKKDLRGKKFNKLTVIDFHSKTKNGHIRYVCKCDCGNYCNILGTHLIQENTKTCGCDKPIGKTHKQWKGCGEISGDFWYSHILRSANGNKGRRHPVELSVSLEQVWDLFLKQERKCALSGLTLTFPKFNKDKSWTASLDRIDSSKGYITENIQWVHKDVNIMKNKYDQDYFISFCKLISNNY